MSYPLNIVYDLKVVCPRLDRYWYFDHMQKAKSRQMTRDGDSVNFLKSVARNAKTGGAPGGQGSQNGQNTPDDSSTSARKGDDPYLSRNFEWEVRQSNFRPEDLG